MYLETCTYLGINQDLIEDKANKAEQLAREFGFDDREIDRIWQGIKSDFIMEFGDGFLSDRFIGMIFDGFAREINSVSAMSECKYVAEGITSDIWIEE